MTAITLAPPGVPAVLTIDDEGPGCPDCGEGLALTQPDDELAARIVGACPACHALIVVDDGAILFRLPGPPAAA